MSRFQSLSRPAAGPSPRRRWGDYALLAALLALVAAGLAGLAAATGWDAVRAQLARLDGPVLATLLGLSMANYLCRGLRWHLAARALGLGTTLAQDLRHFLGGFAMTVTPGRVGELIRMRWLRRETGCPLERTAPLMLIDRAADLAAMAALLGAALILSAAGLAGALPVAGLAIAAAVLVTRPRLLSALVTAAWRLVGRWPRLFARLRAGARTLRRFSHPLTLAACLAIGAAGWLAEGWAFHYLLVWMGAEVDLWTAVAIFVFATLAGGLTGAPGGLGGAEAAMVALLGLQGVPLEIAVPATAVIRLTTLWFAIAVGFAIFPLAEGLSRKGSHALARG